MKTKHYRNPLQTITVRADRGMIILDIKPKEGKGRIRYSLTGLDPNVTADCARAEEIHTVVGEHAAKAPITSRETLKAIVDGELAPKGTDTRAQTFDALAKAYIAWKQPQVSHDEWRMVRQRLHAFCDGQCSITGQRWGDMLPDAANVDEVHHWAGRRWAGPKTRNHFIGAYNGMIKFTRPELQRAKKHAEDGGEPDPYLPEELPTLLVACHEIGHREGDPDFGPMIEFSIETGLRTMDYCPLTIQSLDVQRGLLVFQEAKQKIRVFHRLSPRALEIAREQKRKHGHGLMFPCPETGGKRASNLIYYRMQRAVKGTDLRFRPPKNTRHTYISMMLGIGAPIDFVMNQTGHQNFAIIKKHYARWIDTEAQRELAALLHGQFAALRKPKLAAV